MQIDDKSESPYSGLVVDASVLVAALTNREQAGTWALQLDEYTWLAAPAILEAEVTNILRRLEAKGSISGAFADKARLRLLELPIFLFPFANFSDRIWQLRHNLTVYDAWYVAIAELWNCPLATLDSRLVRSSGPRCQFITPDL